MNIRDLLSDMNLSQQELADFTGIPRDRISKWSLRNQEPPKAADNKIIEEFYNRFQGQTSQQIKAILEAEKNAGSGTANAKPRPNAYDLGPIGDNEATERTKGGNEYVDLGHGKYALTTPLVTQRIYGSYMRGYSDLEFVETLPKHTVIVDNLPHGTYRSFVVYGDSMDDGSKRSISELDVVTGRLIHPMYWGKSKLHLHNYKEYVIMHSEGPMVKEIIDHDVENGIITVHSYNPDKKEYPDKELKLEDVKEIYNVIKVTKNREER